jgi:hypothetical protein
MASLSGFMRVKSDMGSHEARAEVELIDDIVLVGLPHLTVMSGKPLCASALVV